MLFQQENTYFVFGNEELEYKVLFWDTSSLIWTNIYLVNTFKKFLQNEIFQEGEFWSVFQKMGLRFEV